LLSIRYWLVNIKGLLKEFDYTGKKKAVDLFDGGDMDYSKLLINNCNAVMNNMHDGFFVVNPQGRLVMVNQALEDITGFSSQELIGSLCTIFDCDDCDRMQTEESHSPDLWCKLFAQDRICRQEAKIQRKDGRYLPVIKTAMVLKDEEGNLQGAVETIEDISEKEKRDQKIFELTQVIREQEDFYGIVGKSPSMRQLFELVRKAGQSNSSVTIFGESGSGKEVVARAIHECGIRKHQPFIQLNCAALNEHLMESELFGHVKGAFTGATNHRKGRFECAHGGDLFLDEIGDMPLSVQKKLLRVLETKQFERVGETQSMNVDVRFITATNKDLQELVNQGLFREDLYFRLNVVPIHLPPLRERLQDLNPLVRNFIRNLRITEGKDIQGVTPEVMDIFYDYAWPGNIRELRNTLEYAFVTAESQMIKPENLPHALFENQNSEGLDWYSPQEAEGNEEKERLLDALKQANGNQTRAASLLGVSRITVWKRMRKYNINVDKEIRN